jgi:hypothetical protein
VASINRQGVGGGGVTVTNIERANIAVKVARDTAASIGKQEPGAWKNIDRALALRPHLEKEHPGEWPSYCFMPIQVWRISGGRIGIRFWRGLWWGRGRSG